MNKESSADLTQIMKEQFLFDQERSGIQNKPSSNSFKSLHTNDLSSQFTAAAAEIGLQIDVPIIDNEIHRVPVQGKRDMPGWYVAVELNGKVFASFGDWSTGEKRSCNNGGNNASSPLTEKEIEALKLIKTKARLAREKKQQQAAKESSKIWEDSPPAPQDHPYLTNKGIKPHGAKVEKSTGSLLINLKDMDGVHTSIQRIKDPSQLVNENDLPKKLFRYGKKQGCFHVIDGSKDRVYIAEGFATGASINEATGCMVLVAIDSGNLMSVAKGAKKIFDARGGTEIVIAADNDHDKKRNVGLEMAKAAAKEIRAKVIYPTGIEGTDFNDMAAEKGHSHVNNILLKTNPMQNNEVIKSEKTANKEHGKSFPRLIEKKDCLDILHCFDSKPAAREYIVEGLIPINITSVVNSPGGIGKSNLLNLLSAAVATGTDVQPFKIALPRKVLLVNVEDSADDIHRRFFSLGKVYPEIAAKRELLKQNLIIYPGRGLVAPFMNMKGGNPTISSYGKWITDSMLTLQPDLAIFDTKARLYGLDENDNSHAAIWWGLFEKVINQLPTCSVLVAAHSGKSRHDDNSQNSNRGASAFIDNARSNIVLTKLDSKIARDLEIEHPSDYFTMTVAKANYTKTGGTFHFHKVDEGVPKYVNLYNERRSAGLNILIDSIQSYGGKITKRDLTERPAGKEVRTALKKGANFLKADVWPLVVYGSECGLLELEQSNNKTGSASTTIRLSNFQKDEKDTQQELFDKELF